MDLRGAEIVREIAGVTVSVVKIAVRNLPNKL